MFILFALCVKIVIFYRFGSDNIKNKYNKKLLFIGILVLLLTTWLSKHKYKTNYEILDEEAFAKYSNGLVYIGDEEFINSIDANDGDILIIDERTSSDPNMIICNSCDITDKDIRNEILEIICCYEEMYPSKWERSIESMRLEWLCHNMSYYFNYKTDETSEVDLNNEDEDKYDNKILNRILKI